MEQENITLRVVSGQSSEDLSISQNMAKLSDGEIIRYASEALNKELSEDDYEVDRADDSIIVRPRAVYG